MDNELAGIVNQCIANGEALSCSPDCDCTARRAYKLAKELLRMTTPDPDDGILGPKHLIPHPSEADLWKEPPRVYCDDDGKRYGTGPDLVALLRPHPYPAERPSIPGQYLVQYDDDSGNQMDAIWTTWANGVSGWHQSYSNGERGKRRRDYEVIAWWHLPKKFGVTR